MSQTNHLYLDTVLLDRCKSFHPHVQKSQTISWASRWQNSLLCKGHASMPCLSVGKQINFLQSTVSSWEVPAELRPAQSPQQGGLLPWNGK